MSRIAAAFAGIYLITATGLIIRERTMTSNGGNWITLKNMGEFLITFPVSAPLAIMGYEPNLDNKLILAILLLATSALIYGVVSQIVRLCTYMTR